MSDAERNWTYICLRSQETTFSMKGEIKIFGLAQHIPAKQDPDLSTSVFHILPYALRVKRKQRESTPQSLLKIKQAISLECLGSDLLSTSCWSGGGFQLCNSPTSTFHLLTPTEPVECDPAGRLKQHIKVCSRSSLPELSGRNC